LKIIVDTNIVFSAILNINSKIGHILLFSGNEFDFYSCDFLKLEIVKHKKKILKITSYSEDELFEIEFLVTKNIKFVNHYLLDEKLVENAEKELKNIDLNDAPFLALANEMNAKLWTGDKKLANGLVKGGFKDILKTEDLWDILHRNK
jgi:predicted nucleic acid-binding protein